MSNKPRKPAKFTPTGKITLTALSLIGFIGGWNAIARVDNRPAQADELAPLPMPTVAPIPVQPTPWPTIQPLAELLPIPTLVPPAFVPGDQPAALAPAANVSAGFELPALQLSPLPTLAPLPAMPAAPPPPPPMPAPPAGNWNNSSGS